MLALGGSSLISACTPSPGPDFDGVLPADGPNIMMLSLDDANDYVGFLGGYAGQVHTPNLDALAASGRTFDRAYCTVPTCFSSRTSTMWGLTPATLDMVDGSPASWANHDQLHQDTTGNHLSATMAAHGYHTLSRGKTYHEYHADRWHSQESYTGIPQLLLQYPAGPDRFPYGVLPAGTTHPDQETADWFSLRLAAAYDRPFFMAVGLYQPHIPWQLPQWAFDLYPIDEVQLPVGTQGDLDDVPPAGVDLAERPRILGVGGWTAVQSAGTHRQVVQAYLAALSHTDAMVGQILNDLADSPFSDDTYVMTWSDHGFHLGEKMHFRKQALWEQATRVPLTLSGPGVSSDVFDRPVSLLDMAPTIHDLAGAPVPQEWEGQSLVGITDAQADARPARTWWEGSQAVRHQDWRYIEYAEGTSELYDVANDPDEFTNLTDDPTHAAVKASLQAMLA